MTEETCFHSRTR